MEREIKSLGVVGLGVMGFDIAFLYAMKGFRTLVFDAAQSAVDAVEARREQTIERLAKRNRISAAETDTVRTLLIKARGIEELAPLDLVTEAVSENARTKLSVYRALKAAGFQGTLTTNTSSVCRATLLAETACDPKRFALTHFFNPVLYTQMVEVVRGDMESGSADALLNFLRTIGRQPVATQDISGFVSNGILMVYAVMALRLVECGAAIEAVDQAARYLRLLPPLFSFDSWKPSIVEDVTRVMFEHRGDAFLRSSRLLRRLAESNPRFYIGQKANPKIYELAEASGRSLDDEAITRALRLSTLVSAARVVELGEAPATVDFVATEGIKLPLPPLKEIDSLGAGAILAELTRTNRQLGGEPLAPAELLAATAAANQTFYRDGEPNPWLIARGEPAATHARH
jgi:3-hydroxybutyryl-CoA dehydrogenase